jgi:spore coat protein A
LFEGNDEYSRLKVQLGTVQEGIMDYDDAITENVIQNSTEIWEIYNETPDAHPIHLHMVHMQLINRQKFSASVDMESGKPSDIRLQGPPQLPTADEAGWKDTYIMYPGEVTRVIATFDLPGMYVWHCHILSHEDHEMMRPYFVQPVNNAITNKLINHDRTEADIELNIAPNPFNNKLSIQLNLKQSSTLSVIVYDVKGVIIKQLFSGATSAGLKRFELDGTSLSNGTYLCEVVVDGNKFVRKLVLQK